MLAAHGLGPRAGREGVEREKSDASSSPATVAEISTEPASEHAMPDWMRRAALVDVLDVDIAGVDDDRLYRVLDKLHPHLEGSLPTIFGIAAYMRVKFSIAG